MKTPTLDIEAAEKKALDDLENATHICPMAVKRRLEKSLLVCAKCGKPVLENWQTCKYCYSPDARRIEAK